MQFSNWNSCLAELDTALKIGGPFSGSTMADILFVGGYCFVTKNVVWQVESLGLVWSNNPLLLCSNYCTIDAVVGNSSLEG
jgi:hypothetical protein